MHGGLSNTLSVYKSQESSCPRPVARARRRGSVDPLHLPQDPALVRGQHHLVVPDLLKHGSTRELVARFFEVIP